MDTQWPLGPSGPPILSINAHSYPLTTKRSGFMIRIDHLQFFTLMAHYYDPGEHLTVNEALGCNVLAQTCHPLM